MSGRDRDGAARDLERLLTRGVEPSGDGDLLARFHLERDRDAFETLVTRHGPMVRGVCRRLLRDPADIDDAFQATFLVLARKGGGLRDPDRLGPWLHGVAARVAAKARARSARRRTRPLVDDVPARPDDRAEWSDVMAIIDAEVARLPKPHRDALVACLLNGLSEREAARAFDCPVGTIKSRLSRAREALRSRLVRRGIAPATALAAASASAPGSFASPVSASLLRATSSLAAAPASVAALTSGVASTMLTKILASTVALAGGLALAGLSATAWTADPPQALQAVPAPAKAAPKPTASDRDQPDGNLRSILQALLHYLEANGRGNLSKGEFPPPAILSPDGRPLLSWRVSLLPYLNQKELYDQFHLDEPWDGPHNRKLIDKMPAVFLTPGHFAPLGKTRFRGVAAPGAMFGPPPSEGGEVDRGIRLIDVTDGTSNTVFLFVAEDGAEWTRPGELEVSGGLTTGGALPALVEDADGCYVLGMVDGTIRRLPNRPGRRESLLPALLTMAGGEVIDHNVFVPPPPEPEPKSPADFEGRLRRVEEKLDAILKRLDAPPPLRP